MPVSDIQTSFAAGELSPKLYARVDLDKFAVGAALLRNFFVDYRGGVSNRPGTEYIDKVSVDNRLIPFIVSTAAAYVLVFSNELITIYNRGVLVTTVVTPYLLADLFDIQYTQSADVLTLTHPSYAPADLERTSDTTFTYTPVVIGPAIDPPIITTMRAPHNELYCYGYVITAVDLDGKEESLPSNIGVKLSLVQDEFQNVVIGMTWTAPAQPVSRYNIYKWGPNDNATMTPSTTWGFIGNAVACTFSDVNIAPDFSKQPPNYGDPFSGGQFASITVNNGGSSYHSTGNFPNIPYVPLVIVGDGTGAEGWAVLDNSTAKIIGVFLTNPGKNYTTATVTAVGQGGTGATFTYTFTDPDPLYPAATAYLQQRRVFGGSTLKPETLVMSQPGLYNNFNSTPVVLATDAITMSIAAEEVNTIKSFVQVNYGLIAFTTGGSFLINGGTPGAAIDANSPSIQPQVSQGANSLRPLRINYDVIYGQAKGNRIHNLAFAWQKQAYAGADISMLAAHLFDTFSTVDWTYAEEPFKMVWAVRNDGRLLSLTYVPEQDVYAWCRHDTQGLFKSVCSVPEDDVDAVYVIVERHIPGLVDGPCWVYYLERLHERLGCCIYDAWFLDSALSLPLISPDVPLYLNVLALAVDITTFDRCAAVSGPPIIAGSATPYSIEARQGYDPASSARMILAYNEGNSALNDPGGWLNKEVISFCFDRINNEINYSAQMMAFADTITNETGRHLIDGSGFDVAPGGTYSSGAWGNYNTAIKVLETDAVTFNPAYSVDESVPNGIAGSDGTYGYVVDSVNNRYTGPRIVDPLTGNVLVHMFGTSLPCSAYIFERNISYKQRIFPWSAVAGNPNAHMEPMGLTANYWYVDNLPYVLLTPRLLEAGELGVGYITTYAQFDNPFMGTYVPSLEIKVYKQCFSADNKMWAVGYDTIAPIESKLFKFDEPTSAPFGGPVVGGGFTDMTPWTSVTGPNSNIAAWQRWPGFPALLLNDMRDGNLVFIQILRPGAHASASHDPAFFRMDCTYIDKVGGTFDYHEGFITGYMKGSTAATFEPATGLVDADWVVVEPLEVDADIAYHSHTFLDVVYTRRQFFLVVQPVVGGVWTYNAANNQILILTVDLAYGSPPVFSELINAQLWDANYPALAPNAVMKMLDNWETSQSANYFEQLFWSPTDKAWWASGLGFKASIVTLDPTFTYQQWNGWSMPWIRIAPADAGGPPVPGDIIQIGCGKIEVLTVSEGADTLTGTIIAGLDIELPDDPDGLLEPVDAGTWTIVTPSATVSGLDHLEGKEVWALADGEVVGPLTVSSGSVDLETAASSIVVGLKYTQQIQTLYLTTDGIQQGSDQGKRKLITGVTLRVDCTKGLKVGTDFGTMLTPVEELNDTDLFTGDARALTFPQWDERGETCIEQDFPLPATVLGVIVEVTPGDTGS